MAQLRLKDWEIPVVLLAQAEGNGHLLRRPHDGAHRPQKLVRHHLKPIDEHMAPPQHGGLGDALHHHLHAAHHVGVPGEDVLLIGLQHQGHVPHPGGIHLPQLLRPDGKPPQLTELLV